MDEMRREPERLQREEFDLLILGGGITGATLAHDAVLRGLKVALVDQGDFASATTSATSKLIHGGLRYLKNGEVGLVRESLRERRILQTIAPHLVRPQPFLIPTYRRGNRRLMIKAGMVAYDMLSYDRGRLEDPDQRLPGHHMLSPSRVLEVEPGVSPVDLTGGAVYYDCRCEPERLCLEFILAAASRGALVVNYARATHLDCREGRVQAVEVCDRLSGKKLEVLARAVANVAGPWADHLELLCGVGEQVALKRSKGIHLITRPLTREHAVVLRTSGGRHFFLVPWRGHSLIGTTDTEYLGELEKLQVTDQDVADFIAEINEAYPSAALKAADVLYRYAGVRPLVEQETQVYQASRKYEIIDFGKRGVRGLFSAVGGKYTTSRNLARKMMDLILPALGRPAVDCQTATTLLPGAVPGSFAEFCSASLGEAGGLVPEDVLRYLVSEYGGRHRELLALLRRDPGLGERVQAGRPEILAQVVFSIEAEMASTLCDIITRRTGIGTLGQPGQEALSKVSTLAARLLGWDAARLEREKQAYRDKVLGLPERAAFEGADA